MRFFRTTVFLLSAIIHSSVIAREMAKAEEPEAVGLFQIRSELSDESSPSLPLEEANFRASNALVVAKGIKGNTTYCYTLTVKSETAISGRVSFESDAVFYGKHVPIEIPKTRGEWQRISFYFRTAPGTTEAMIRFNATPHGKTCEAKEPHLRVATEDEFTEAWKRWRAQYPVRDLSPRPDDGKDLERFIGMLQSPPPGVDELLVYGIGSSYTNMLGNGERLLQWIKEHFPNAPKIVYKKHVGSAVAYDFTRGWMRQLVLGEKPDLVILYSEGTGEDLEKLLKDFRTHSAADIIVASLHLRERAKVNTPATVYEEKWQEIRAAAEKYDCEWVDNRVEHAAYLTKHGKPLEWLLKDAVHQSDHGALVINENIMRHLAPRNVPGKELAASLPEKVTAYRVDIYGKRSRTGKVSQVRINGRPANEFPAFVTTVIVPRAGNHQAARGSTADRSPHLIRFGDSGKIVPQTWTITMTSDTGDFKLTGSVTGADGGGNNAAEVTSASGQIVVPSDLWRRRINPDGTHANLSGDVFTWEVRRSTLGEVDFSGPDGEPFRVTLAYQLPKEDIVLEVDPPAAGEGEIIGFDIMQPALP